MRKTNAFSTCFFTQYFSSMMNFLITFVQYLVWHRKLPCFIFLTWSPRKKFNSPIINISNYFCIQLENFLHCFISSTKDYIINIYLHLNFLCCVIYFLRTCTLDLAHWTQNHLAWSMGCHKCLSKIEHNNTFHTLILSGDHLFVGMLPFDSRHVAELHGLPKDGCQVPQSGQAKVASHQTDGPRTKLGYDSCPSLLVFYWR